MQEKYPREVLMKIKEVVIFLENLDFLKNPKKNSFLIFIISNDHNIHATEKIGMVAVFFKYYFAFLASWVLILSN
jgi:hypothetical protein